MTLVLYSSQETPEDEKVNVELVRLLGPGKKRLAWLGCDFQTSGGWFEAKQQYYRRLGVHLDSLVEVARQAGDWDAALAGYDGLHLSGGSTPLFLQLIRDNHFAEPLLRFLGRGGIVIGVSAGAILLTPHIATAFECRFADTRPSSAFDLRGLSIVDFLFFPHFEEEFAGRCQAIASEHGRTLYACRDGDGLVVQRGNVRLLGELKVF